MTLPEFARLYLQSRQVSETYARRITKRAAALELRCGETAIERVLTEAVVNAFLKSLDLSPFTVRCYRGDLLSLWNAAADLDLVPYPVARRIVRMNRPALHVDCYSIDEARLLLLAADELPGRYKNQVLKRAYWTAAIRLAWDTGIRRGDVWGFRRDRVRPDGTTRIVQHKTGQAVPAKLWPTTIAALDEIGGPQPCRWSLDPTFFGRHFKTIVKAAGVNRGSFKWLRRASGSYVDLAQPGAGGKHLGHSDPATFGKFYDAKLGDHNLPMPPEL